MILHLSAEVEAKAVCHRIGRRRPVIVFTSGCFDVMHAGHIAVLDHARSLAQGGALFVAVNGDASVRTLKGEGRPIVPLSDRLALVDAVTRGEAYVFPLLDTNPTVTVRGIDPTIIVKGGDYTPETVPEAEGRRLVLVPHTGQSTTKILSRKE